MGEKRNCPYSGNSLRGGGIVAILNFYRPQTAQERVETKSLPATKSPEEVPRQSTSPATSAQNPDGTAAEPRKVQSAIRHVQEMPSSATPAQSDVAIKPTPPQPSPQLAALSALTEAINKGSLSDRVSVDEGSNPCKLTVVRKFRNSQGDQTVDFYILFGGLSIQLSQQKPPPGYPPSFDKWYFSFSDEGGAISDSLGETDLHYFNLGLFRDAQEATPILDLMNRANQVCRTG